MQLKHLRDQPTELIGPAVDYHSDFEFISRSDLATFAFSRREFKRRRDQKRTDDNDILRIGKGTHAIALRDTIELDRVKLIPESALSTNGQRRGNAWTKFRLKNRGKTLFLPKQWELCQRIAAEFERVKIAETPGGDPITVGDFVKNPNAQREVEHLWNDVLPCRLKADLVFELPDVVICLDLKTARSVEESRFRSEIRKRKLWLQVAHYSAGLEDKFGKPVRFVFVAIEKAEPYPADIFELDPPAVELAKRGRVALLEELRGCLETGVFLDPPKGGIKLLSFTPDDFGIVV